MVTKYPTDKGDVAYFIRLGRDARGISRDALALHLGIDEYTLYLMEKGINEISSYQLSVIADFLDLPLRFFTSSDKSDYHNEGFSTLFWHAPKEDLCFCGVGVCEALCDWPLSNTGQTCDVKMCFDHRGRVDAHRDYCPEHLTHAEGMIYGTL